MRGVKRFSDKVVRKNKELECVIPAIRWKTGFEIELLAPRGKSRRDLAEAIAVRPGCRVAPCFHPQAELAAVPGAPIFENLTLGYEALAPDGSLMARCVDDLTLQADLARKAPPKPGWYRIASDDARLLRLIMRHCDPAQAPAKVLLPVARLFGTEPTISAEGMVRLADALDAPIAIAAPLPGERERPCELITPPISHDHAARLEALLAPARALGFTVPVEGALHIHYDATDLCTTPVLVNLVKVLERHGDALKQLLDTNRRCIRLGGWPQALLDLVADPQFALLAWEDAKARLVDIGLTKYCDFNLLNLVRPPPGKHTFEVRILPVSLDAAPILQAAGLFEAILRWAGDDSRGVRDVPADIVTLFSALPLAEDQRQEWIGKCGKMGLSR